MDTGVITGDQYVNGHPPPVDFRAQSCVLSSVPGSVTDFPLVYRGYCQQTDTHVPTDTVREALLFSAMVRQPESVPVAEKVA